MKTLIPLTGYTDRLSARPGDCIEFKVSSNSKTPFTADLIKVICADPNPAGPGLVEEEIDIEFGGTFPSREQSFFPGSYAQVDVGDKLAAIRNFSLITTIWPTIIGKDRQCIMGLGDKNSTSGLNLFLDENGCLSCSYVNTITVHRVSLGIPLRLRRWYQILCSFDQAQRKITLGFRDLINDSQHEVSELLESSWSLGHLTQIRIAADHQTPADSHFNGKIESPMIIGNHLSIKELCPDIVGDRSNIIIHWDFSKRISTKTIEDVGPFGCHGTLINLPARAMTSSRWDGSEMCWRHAPDQYAAIHFHDDDIYDFEWETDFTFTIPNRMKSGIYAARIRCGEYVDKIPFFVCAPRDKPAAKLCVLVSTFTYTVYGNHARPDFTVQWLDRIKEWNAYPWNPSVYSEYGLSTYNDHSDGSGICHASNRRPLMTLRPGYITFGASENGCSGLRHFQADSHLITWLEWNHIDYDIVTDQELHDDGVEAIRHYSALTTGSHPEYHTDETLNAISDYRKEGGNFMYLGGNGFYWRVALHPEDHSSIEIRRAEGGIRAWAAEPGEYYQAFDGNYGGLWRRNGRPPQQVAGVGFSAQGAFYGSYFCRNESAVNHADTSWIFNGIDDVILGDFGLSGGGAAGFELDRVDYRLGSADDIHILASSENHDESFVLVPEEQLTHITNWPGEPVESLIKADMVYQYTKDGGQLFASGSITFCGSLLHNNGDNNISRLLMNIITRFTG